MEAVVNQARTISDDNMNRGDFRTACVSWRAEGVSTCRSAGQNGELVETTYD